MAHDDDDDRIDLSRSDELARWSRKLGASEEELRRAVDQVGARVKDVRSHLFGGFTSAGPSS